MDHSAVFRQKYDSLRRTFEARLASLADTIRWSIDQTAEDEIFVQLNASESSREFAPAHALSLIKRHLAAERDAYFHSLALKLADAEADASRCKKRNEELANSLRALRANASRGERVHMKVATAETEIQELRREYQIALQDAGVESRQMEADLADRHHRSAVLTKERDEQAAQLRSLQAALADARARVLEVDRKRDSLPRLERELGEERSANVKLSSELAHAQARLGELAASHQRLKFQAQSLRNDVSQRDKRLQLADANSSKTEAQFRDAIARMESLLEEEGRDSAAAIKELRDKAVSAKGRLSTEVERLKGANVQLTQAVAAAKAESSGLRHQAEAALKCKQADASGAAAREEVLRVDVEQARARADTMSQSLAETIREQSGLVAETANAKATAEVLEAKIRAAELERAQATGREAERCQALTNQCTPSTVPGPGWWVDLSDSFGDGIEKLLADNLEDASRHISELRIMLRQEVGRREVAEAEVSEAQGYLNSSRQELGELRHLAWKLEEMGRNSIAHIDEKNQAIKQLEEQLHYRGAGAPVGEREGGLGGKPRCFSGRKRRTLGRERGREERRGRESEDRMPPRRASRGTESEGLYMRDMSAESGESTEPRREFVKDLGGLSGYRNKKQRNLSGKETHKTLLRALSGLRSDLQGVNDQLEEAKAENEGIARRFAEGVAMRAERLMKALQQADREKIETQRQASEAHSAAAKDRESAAGLTRVIQGISQILLDALGVAVPSGLSGGDVVGEDVEGVFEKRLSELSAAVSRAVSRVEERAKHAVLGQLPSAPCNVEPSTSAGRQDRALTIDGMIWGDRSKEDFNMLAQLQKIEVESELQWLRARLAEMTDKYSRAVAERDNVDSPPSQEARERAQEEAGRAADAHASAIAALEATLAVEKSRCQDLRVRLERQTREHQVELTEADKKIENKEHELDKVQQALEQTQFTLGRESARRARLEKKYSEMEERGLVSPRLVTPRVVRYHAHARGWKRDDTSTTPGVQPSLLKVASAREVLEEARAKLGRESGDMAPVSSGEEAAVKSRDENADS